MPALSALMTPISDLTRWQSYYYLESRRVGTQGHLSSLRRVVQLTKYIH
jgi:hypothetical protein